MEEIGSTEMSAITTTLDLAIPGGNPVKLKNLPPRGELNRSYVYLTCRSRDMRRIVAVVEKVKVQDNSRRTHLQEVCKYKNHSVVVTRMSNGIKIDLFHIDGSIPLLVKSYWNGERSSRHVRAGDGEILFIKTFQNCFRTPALHMACKVNAKEAVCVLLRMGANVGAKNSLGMTALHYASQASARDVIDILVDNGEDVNAKDCHGDTPLHLVASLKALNVPVGFTYETIDKMLCHGARVLEKNNNLETPYETLHLAISSHALSGPPLLEDKEIRVIEASFIKHVTKLEELKQQDIKFDTEWKLGPDFYKKIQLGCRRELEYMKSATIVKGISLYDVLFRTNKPYRMSSDDLKHIDEYLCSPNIYQKYPLYTLSLRTTFQRPKLLTLAVQSFYTERRKQMVKQLPCEVTEQLLTYLTNEDLRNFIRSE